MSRIGLGPGIWRRSTLVLKRLSESADQAWARLVSTPSLTAPAAVILINLALYVITNQLVLRDFPNSGDEYSYFIMATTFAEGRLSVPSPEPREFFSFIHIINDGRFYGKYEPGWPAILTPGVALGVPWLVNPLVGTLTLAAMYVIARRYFSVEVANVSMYLSLFNPFLAFNCGSYFNHPSCHLFITLALGATVALLREPTSKAASLLLGFSVGAAFLIRPFTALAVAAPTFAYVSYRLISVRQGKRLIVALGWMAIPASACLSLYLVYNDLQTGDPFLSPRLLYAEEDRPSLSLSLPRLADRLSSHLVLRILAHVYWLPLAPLFIVLYLCLRSTRANRDGIVLASSLLALLIAHYFYGGIGGNRYGPRHFYEATAALLIVSACVVRAVGVQGVLMVLGVLVMNITQYREAAVFHSRQIEERMEVYDLVERQGISNAIVFLGTGSGTMPRGDLTRNGIHFIGPVLYVYDRGADNRRLLQKFPDRKAYSYEYDSSTSAGQLVPYEEGR